MHWALNAGVSFLSGVAGGLLAIGFCFWLAGAGDPWIGFAGSIISGAMTLVAAAAAFGLTRKQVNMQADELRELKEEKEQRANTLRSMIFFSAFQVSASAKLAKIALDDQEGSIVSQDEIPIIQELRDMVQVGEAWRLSHEIAVALMTVEVAIRNFNGIKDAFKCEEGIAGHHLFRSLDEVISSCQEVMVLIGEGVVEKLDI